MEIAERGASSAEKLKVNAEKTVSNAEILDFNAGTPFSP